MANALFTPAKVSFLTAGFSLSSSNIKAVLVDHGTDTPVPSTDQYLSDIGAGARIGTSSNLGSKTTTGGVFDAADTTISAVSGASVESIVTYVDSGSAASSNLVVYQDTGTNLPVTPNGGDITISWNASGIFAL